MKILNTKIVNIKNINTIDKYLEEACEIIKMGGTVVFPTETVYDSYSWN